MLGFLGTARTECARMGMRQLFAARARVMKCFNLWYIINIFSGREDFAAGMPN